MEKFDIYRFAPCKEGRKYYEKKRYFRKAWNDCPRGDWMLWIADVLKIDHRLLTKAKARCANTIRHLIVDAPYVDLIDEALRYSDGEIDREELNRHGSTALKAIETLRIHPYFYAAAIAAIASAADTLSADCAASYAATASMGYAMEADSSGEFMITGNTAQEANQLQTANICREMLTDAVFEKVNELKKNN
jgi:hypothetical protein